jgi:hypothetical protein
MGVPAEFFPRFKKVLSRVGSDREGERHTAADHAFRMCDDEDLSFLEAVDGAFAASPDDELLRQMQELEDDNRKLAEAVNLLNAQQGIAANALQQFGEKLWSYPQTRLVCVLAFIWVSFWLLLEIAAHFDTNGIIGTALIAGVSTFSLGFAPCLAISWLVAEFARAGAGVAVLKAIPMAICIGLCITLYVVGRDIAMATVVLLFTFVLCVTNIIKWLAHELEQSNSDVFRTLRSWFE